MEILSETLFFSTLVSLFTQGMGAAANNGGILYPLKLWMEQVSRNRKIEKRKDRILRYREYRRQKHYQYSEWLSPALMKLDLQIMYRNMWHKPLLTCMVCMSSFWGIVLYLSLFTNYGIHILLLGVPVSAAVTVLTNKLRQ